MRSFSIKLGLKEVPGVAGRLDVNIEGDEVSVKVNFGALQDPRFFEKIVRDRDLTEVPYVMSRICGVCSVVHLTCSILAIERALGIEPVKNVLTLRKIAKGLEIVQNNIIHVLMTVPDFTGVENVIEFSKQYPSLFSRMIELNSNVLDVYKRIGGRFVHTPSIGMVFHGKPVYKQELESVSRRLLDVSNELCDLSYDLSELWRPVLPSFEDAVPTYCALDGREEYAFFSRKLYFSDGVCVPAERYNEVIKELKTDYSNAHYTLYKDKPFYTGARARIQLHYDLLTENAKNVEKILAPEYSNPFDNVKAQYIEAVYLSEVLSSMAKELADSIKHSIKPFYLKRDENHDGEGVGLATAPRGTLIHHYKIKNGGMYEANVITPTVINARHIEINSEKLIKTLMDAGEDDEKHLRKVTEALLRSYDPCLPCAVH